MVVATVMDLLNSWNVIGIDYVLTFLLVFAFVFGILSGTKIIGDKKPVHIIIALVIGLMSLKWGMAVDFFTGIFPRAAIAIAVIIVLVILTTVFVPDAHRIGWSIGLYSVGGIAFLFVLFNTFSERGWYSSLWWDQWGGLLIGALLIIGVIIAVSVAGSDKPRETRTPQEYKRNLEWK